MICRKLEAGSCWPRWPSVQSIFFWFWPGRAALATFSPIRSGGQTLVLDAGHGGEDGGGSRSPGYRRAESIWPLCRSWISFWGLYGEAPLLLRSEDISLHDDSAQTLREKKVSDLHNRVARIEETEHAVLLSVHQNTFPDGKYHGAQVFYSNGELSQPLAQLTQETLRAALDPGNTREAKPIPDSVYLMNHITCPAILVECGFLSNAEEDLLLQSGAYQTKLASALAASWLQWLDEEGRGEGFSLQKGRRRLRMKAKTLFYCTECGNETPKWSGQCPACRAWNTLVERPAEPKKKECGRRLCRWGAACGNRQPAQAHARGGNHPRAPL